MTEHEEQEMFPDPNAPESSFAHPDNYYLLEALEIVSKESESMEHYIAWGVLIDDPEIIRLESENRDRSKSVVDVPMKKMVLGMSVDERRALRDRVKAQLEKS